MSHMDPFQTQNTIVFIPYLLIYNNSPVLTQLIISSSFVFGLSPTNKFYSWNFVLLITFISFKSLMVLSINISLSHSVLFGLRMIAL